MIILGPLYDKTDTDRRDTFTLKLFSPFLQKLGFGIVILDIADFQLPSASMDYLFNLESPLEIEKNSDLFPNVGKTHIFQKDKLYTLSV